MQYSPEWGDSARQSQIFFANFSSLQENGGVFSKSYLSAKSRYASEICNQKWEIRKQELDVVDKAGHGASIKDIIGYNSDIIFIFGQRAAYAVCSYLQKS